MENKTEISRQVRKVRLPSVEIDSFIPIGTTKNGRNANHDLDITPNPLRTLQPTKLTALAN